MNLKINNNCKPSRVVFGGPAASRMTSRVGSEISKHVVHSVGQDILNDKIEKYKLKSPFNDSIPSGFQGVYDTINTPYKMVLEGTLNIFNPLKK